MSLDKIRDYRALCVAAGQYWQPAIMDGTAKHADAALADFVGGRDMLRALCSDAGVDAELVADAISDAIEQSQHYARFTVERNAAVTPVA